MKEARAREPHGRSTAAAWRAPRDHRARNAFATVRPDGSTHPCDGPMPLATVLISSNSGPGARGGLGQACDVEIDHCFRAVGGGTNTVRGRRESRPEEPREAKRDRRGAGIGSPGSSSHTSLEREPEPRFKPTRHLLPGEMRPGEKHHPRPISRPGGRQRRPAFTPPRREDGTRQGHWRSERQCRDAGRGCGVQGLAGGTGIRVQQLGGHLGRDAVTATAPVEPPSPAEARGI